MRRQLTLIAVPATVALALAGTASVATADGGAADRGASSTTAHKVVPPPAAKAGQVTVGYIYTPGANYSNNAATTTAVQTTVATVAATWDVPGAGVITSVSHDEGTVGGTFRMVLFGALSGNIRTILGETSDFPSPANTLVTVPVRVPVAAGTTLGIYTPNSTQSAAKIPLTAGDIYSAQVTPFTAGSPFDTTLMHFSPRLVNLSAIWEPDVDGDGFGDVSQDACPQSATTQGACPAPDTSAKKPRLVGKNKVKFKFSSTIAGSSFVCAIDSNNFVPCASPLKKKFSYGKHVIQVAAVSPAGVVDPTPFKGKFKLVRR